MKDEGIHGRTRRHEKPRRLISLHVGPYLHRAYREMLDAPVVAVSLATVVGATVVYSVTGPVGRDDTFSTAQRLFFVSMCTLLSWPFCHSFCTLVLYCARRRQPYVIALTCIAKVPFMAIPCSAVAYTVFELFGRDAAGRLWDIYFNVTVWLAACCAVVHYTACLRARVRHTDEVAAAEVLSTSGSPSSAAARDETHEPRGTAVPRKRDRRQAGEDDDAEGPRPAGSSRNRAERRNGFLDRLPPRLGRDVIYLNVSGHYVSAVTAEGSGVILMRFADAVAELGDVGMQVHRSYWVAHRHITGILRRDERTMVRVTGGHELPVSRTYLTAVRALIPHIERGTGSDLQGSPPPAARGAENHP